MIKSIDREKQSEFIDCIYEYRGLWDMPSKCGLKIFRKQKHDVAVATEMYAENPGTSVTNWCEKLANQICNENALDPDKFLFIVHTPDTKSKLSFLNESFFIVHFERENGRFVNPRWEETSRENVVRICSE